MIIKDKPFHVPACQAISCAYYFPAGVIGCSVIPFGWCCDIANVRRWPGFVKLEAYQVRLSRFLVMRRSDAVFDRDLDLFKASPDWLHCDWSVDDDGLMHAGGVM